MKNNILFSFRRCPYAIRARLALLYCNIDYDTIEVSLKERPEELFEVSKKGTVPVLITKNSKVIDESLDIMIWALKSNQNQTWLSNNNDELELIYKNDIIFKNWLDKYKYFDRHPEFPKNYYREKCDNILMDYEYRLSKTKYLIKKSISICDIAIFPFVRQFANVDYEWFDKRYKNLVLWYESILSSNLFKDVMKKKQK